MVNTVQTNAASNQSPVRYRPSFWPYAIIIFFAIIAAANGVLAYLAVSSRSAYLDDRPYERGLEYEQVIDQKRNANSLGQEPRYVLHAAGNNQNVEIRVLFEQNNPFGSDSTAELQMLRPNDSNLDLRLDLVPTAEGFSAPANSVAAGLWIVRLKITSGGKSFLFESREFFKNGGLNQ